MSFKTCSLSHSPPLRGRMLAGAICLAKSADELQSESCCRSTKHHRVSKLELSYLLIGYAMEGSTDSERIQRLFTAAVARYSRNAGGTHLLLGKSGFSKERFCRSISAYFFGEDAQGKLAARTWMFSLVQNRLHWILSRGRNDCKLLILLVSERGFGT
jgi:hypothetical protein